MLLLLVTTFEVSSPLDPTKLVATVSSSGLIYDPLREGANLKLRATILSGTLCLELSKCIP